MRISYFTNSNNVNVFNNGKTTVKAVVANSRKELLKLVPRSENRYGNQSIKNIDEAKGTWLYFAIESKSLKHHVVCINEFKTSAIVSYRTKNGVEKFKVDVKINWTNNANPTEIIDLIVAEKEATPVEEMTVPDMVAALAEMKATIERERREHAAKVAAMAEEIAALKSASRKEKKLVEKVGHEAAEQIMTVETDLNDMAGVVNDYQAKADYKFNIVRNEQLADIDDDGHVDLTGIEFEENSVYAL